MPGGKDSRVAVAKLFIAIAIPSIIATLWVFIPKGKTPFFPKNSDWEYSSCSRVPDVEIFTAPKPARRIALWNGFLYVATGGGLFKLQNDALIAAITTADGLPSNDIHDISPSGSDLLLATANGLAIIEPSGRVFRIWHGSSAAANRINRIVSSAGNFLMATDGGLFILRDDEIYTVCDSGRFVAVTGTPNGFIAADDNGQLWSIIKGNIVPMTAELPKIAAMQYSDGMIYAATGNGAAAINLGGEHIRSIDASRKMATFILSRADTILVGGFGGIDIFVNERKTRTIGIPRNWGAVRDIAITGDGIILCGDGGVIDENGNAIHANAPIENRITAICRHRNVLWVGTFSSGVAFMQDGQWKEPTYRLPSPFVNALASDGRNLWIATDDGLVRLYGGLTVFRRRDGLNSNTITALHFDGNNLWVGTNRGFCRSEHFGWRQFYLSDGLCGDHIYAIAAKSGNAWVAAYGGVSRISDESGKCYRRADNALLNDWATAAIISSDGVFIGTYGGGISRYNESRWTFYEENAIINPDAATSMLGNPIFGTAGEGILIWDGMRFFKLTIDDGLPDNEILSLFAEDGYIWVGTTHGLAKIAANIE